MQSVNLRNFEIAELYKLHKNLSTVQGCIAQFVNSDLGLIRDSIAPDTHNYV